MTATASAFDATSPDLHAVQGNLIGFNKDHQRLVFVHFPDAPTARAFIQALEPNVANGYEVKAFNELYKELRAKRGGENGIIQAAWTNVVFSFAGLSVLAPSGLGAFPAEFRDGMAAHAADLGDVENSAPSTWVSPFDQPQQVHAMVILAADDPRDLDDCYARLQAKIQAAGIAELGHQDGNVRPDAERGHEHFGFKDGISQPAIRGLTTSSKNPDKTIEPGEFVIGYPDETGHISGQPDLPPPPPQPGDPNYPGPPPSPPADPMPTWATDGSFVVYRRLRQDVGGFNSSLAAQAPNVSLSVDQLGAKLVGRWPSGAPLERVPGLPNHVDPSTGDPSVDHPHVLDDDHINAFGYAADPDGTHVPRSAHIRKTYPRDQANPGLAEADRHRILRRGIPYGPEFQPSEPPYGQGPIADDRDRGLLFICYQASIQRGFAFIQQTWVNTPDFPMQGDGQDPIISQQVDPREFNLPPNTQHLSFQRWVFTTAGEYFFSPSMPALQALASGSA